MWDDKRRVARDEPRLLGNQDTPLRVNVTIARVDITDNHFSLHVSVSGVTGVRGQDSWVESPPVTYGKMLQVYPCQVVSMMGSVEFARAM